MLKRKPAFNLPDQRVLSRGGFRLNASDLILKTKSLVQGVDEINVQVVRGEHYPLKQALGCEGAVPSLHDLDLLELRRQR